MNAFVVLICFCCCFFCILYYILRKGYSPLRDFLVLFLLLLIIFLLLVIIIILAPSNIESLNSFLNLSLYLPQVLKVSSLSESPLSSSILMAVTETNQEILKEVLKKLNSFHLDLMKLQEEGSVIEEKVGKALDSSLSPSYKSLDMYKLSEATAKAVLTVHEKIVFLKNDIVGLNELTSSLKDNIDLIEKRNNKNIGQISKDFLRMNQDILQIKAKLNELNKWHDVFSKNEADFNQDLVSVASEIKNLSDKIFEQKEENKNVLRAFVELSYDIKEVKLSLASEDSSSAGRESKTAKTSTWDFFRMKD